MVSCALIWGRMSFSHCVADIQKQIFLSKPSVHINRVSLSLWELPVFALSYKPLEKWHVVKTNPCRSVLHNLVRDPWDIVEMTDLCGQGFVAVGAHLGPHPLLFFPSTWTMTGKRRFELLSKFTCVKSAISTKKLEI